MKKLSEGVDPLKVFDAKFPVVTRERGNSYISHIYLTDSIEGPYEFHQIVEVLGSAESEDTVIFKLNGPGGCAAATVMLISAMRESKAHIVCEITGPIASALTMILLAADEIKVVEWGSMMIHFYSGGVYGKGNEIEAEMKFSIPHMKALFRSVYIPFITEEECEDVIKGQDLYLGRDEILGRWNILMDKRVEDAEKAIQDAFEEAKQAEITAAKEILEKYDL